MRMTIWETFDVNVGDYWRDRVNARHIVSEVAPNKITAISENTSTPRDYSADKFYKNFFFESSRSQQ